MNISRSDEGKLFRLLFSLTMGKVTGRKLQFSQMCCNSYIFEAYFHPFLAFLKALLLLFPLLISLSVPFGGLIHYVQDCKLKITWKLRQAVAHVLLWESIDSLDTK